MSQSRPTIVIQAPKLREQYRNMVIAEAQKRAISFQEPRYGQEACLFVYGDSFTVSECNNSKFYFTSNHIDPENVPTTGEVVTKLIELMKDGGLESSVKPEQFYGGYANSLTEALEAIDKMKDSPVSEWPKEYNKPKLPLVLADLKKQERD